MCAIRRQYSGEVKYCWPVSCWCGVDVPETEFGLEAAVALPRHAAGHQRLRVDLLPAIELRRGVDVGDALDEGGLIDRREQPAALEIVGDDLRHADADLGIAWRARHEIRDRDRERNELTFGNGDPLRRLRKCAANRRGRDRAKRSHSGNDLPAARAEQHVRQSIFVSHRFNLAHICHCQWVSATRQNRQTFSLNTGAKYFHSS